MNEQCGTCGAINNSSDAFCASCGAKLAAAPQTIRKLYLSQTDKQIAGVCGGIAKYENMDSGIVRLVVILATLFSGGAVIVAYLIAALILQPDPAET